MGPSLDTLTPQQSVRPALAPSMPLNFTCLLKMKIEQLMTRNENLRWPDNWLEKCHSTSFLLPTTGPQVWLLTLETAPSPNSGALASLRLAHRLGSRWKQLTNIAIAIKIAESRGGGGDGAHLQCHLLGGGGRRVRGLKPATVRPRYNNPRWSK